MSEQDALRVRRAQQGDRQAFAALVSDSWTRLVRIARSVVGDAEAEDVVQDGLLRAWDKLPSLRDPAAFQAWVTRLVLRLCLRRQRSWSFAKLAGNAAWIHLEQAPEPSYESSVDADLDLLRLLRNLAPRQRAVLHLTVVEGMSDSEIAELLGITAASVRSHRRRARASIARTWQPMNRQVARNQA